MYHIYMETALKDTRPPEIWETAEDKLLSVNKLKKSGDKNRVPDRE